MSSCPLAPARQFLKASKPGTPPFAGAFCAFALLCAVLYAPLTACAANAAGTAGASAASTPAAPVQNAPRATPPLLAGTADQAGGYSGQVLEQVMRHFAAPANRGTSLARVLVRIGTDGRPLSCDSAALAARTEAGGLVVRPLHEGGAPGTAATGEAAMVEAVCRAVAQAGSFGPPPYGMATEVYLTLADGPLTPAASPYAAQVMERVRPHIHLPIRLGGPFEVTVRVKVAADGRCEAIQVERSSGKAEADAAIMQAFATPGVLPPPGEPRELVLSFTVQGE